MGCLLAGGWDGQHIAGDWADRRRLVGCRNRHPLPPPPLTIGGGAPPEIFPTFLPTGVCPFSNLNDN